MSRYSKRLSVRINKMNPELNNFPALKDLVKKHEEWMGETINLIASEKRFFMQNLLI